MVVIEASANASVRSRHGNRAVVVVIGFDEGETSDAGQTAGRAQTAGRGRERDDRVIGAGDDATG